MSLAKQKLRESIPFIHPAWISLAVGARVAALVPPLKRPAQKLAMSIHRIARSETARLTVEPLVRQCTQRLPRGAHIDLDREFGPNRVFILKPYRGGAEKGVIKLMFNETIGALPAVAGFKTLSEQYRMVLEPSWTGFATSQILQYAELVPDVVLLTGAQSDFEFMSRLGRPFAPIRLGPCDWVDPRHAEPFLSTPKRFDIVMNSNWADWKRHYVLFEALTKMPKDVKVALIGVQWDGRTREDITALIDHFGVSAQITIFEKIPYKQVMEVTAGSHISILLSLKEGSNRALAESIFCNVPVMLLSSHWGGITKNVTKETGMLSTEKDLPENLMRLIQAAKSGQMSPRQWGIDNISCVASTARLNAFIRQMAIDQGEPWTSDIHIHSNSPECTYYDPNIKAALAPHYAMIKECCQ